MKTLFLVKVRNSGMTRKSVNTKLHGVC